MVYRYKPGFTIVELLVVIVVIGVLAAITTVSYTGISQKAVEASLSSDLANASTQLKMFQVEFSNYPTTISTNCVTNPDTPTNKCLKVSPGNSYNYYQANNSSNPQIFSLNTTNTNGTSFRITDSAQPKLSSDTRTSCLAILNASESSGDGIYWIKPSGTTIPAYCDMTTDGGGWTLAVRLNTNDATTQKWDSAFWSASTEQGLFTNKNDYLSPAYYNLTVWDKILIDYRYTNGQIKRMAAAFSGSNSGTLKAQTTRSLNNSNPSWTRYYTNNSDATNWYGSALIFQTNGDGNDSTRIWYNRVAATACNQNGGIGVFGDGGANFTAEVSPPCNVGGCQWNGACGVAGINGYEYNPACAKTTPTDAYDAGIMYVLIK